MNNIKNHSIIMILGLAAMLILSTIAYAQDSNQDQSRSNQDQMSSQNMSFGNDAQQLASRLAQQLGATTGVADKITQVLLDYRNDLADARHDFLSKNQNTGNQDVTGGQGRLSNIDSNPDLVSEYSKADVKADKDIIDALDNDAQKAKYMQIKKQWWKDVKNSVYPIIKQTSGQESE